MEEYLREAERIVADGYSIEYALYVVTEWRLIRITNYFKGCKLMK